MIVKNNTLRAYFYEGVAIVPGTNTVDKDLNPDHPVIKALLESGKLEIVEGEKLDASAAIKAINEANNVAAVDAIAKLCDGKNVKAAATKRKKEIAAAMKEIADAEKKAATSKDDDEDENDED